MSCGEFVEKAMQNEFIRNKWLLAQKIDLFLHGISRILKYLEHLHKIGSQWFTNVFLHGSPLLITQRVLHVADNGVDPFEGQAAATIRMRNQGDFFEPRQVDPDDEGAAVTHGP